MKSTHQEDKAAPGIVQFPVSQMSQTTQVLSCEYTPDVVVVGSQSSQSLDISAGVPQGSDLGPTIFSCFINDLPSIIRSEDTFQLGPYCEHSLTVELGYRKAGLCLKLLELSTAVGVREKP
ncbi:uncharacterized protein LOC144494809 isoform X2 [Mustelus asterias]